MPERDFFFDILGTVKPDYLKQIIEDAGKVRFTADPQKAEKDCIMIDDSWLQELTQHPYLSRKTILLTYIGKPGRAIYLMKQRAKLVKVRKNVNKHSVQRRLSEFDTWNDENYESSNLGLKRRKLTDSTRDQSSLMD